MATRLDDISVAIGGLKEQARQLEQAMRDNGLSAKAGIEAMNDRLDQVVDTMTSNNSSLRRDIREIRRSSALLGATSGGAIAAMQLLAQYFGFKLPGGS